MIITASDLNLVKQPVQRRYIMLQVLDRDFTKVYTIQGFVKSGNINIDSSSDVRRTASLTMNFKQTDINKIIDLNINYYIKILLGIEDNETKQTSWYSQGVFIINSNGLSYNLTDKTLTLSLSDLMYDFTGERRGVLSAYNPLIMHDEKIQDVMIDLVEVNGGIKNHDITPICPYSDGDFWYNNNISDDIYLIPYDMNFSTGVSIYEVLKKLATLYPQWEIFFDANGKFICQKEVLKEDDSAVILDDRMLTGLKINEDLTIDYTNVKNIIEIWGKDGLYHGVAKDETASSPFNVNAIGEIRKSFSGGEYDNIQNTYLDDDLTVIASYGNDDAQDWAESLLYQYSRLQDKITINILNCPFINETNFKISYRSKLNNQIKVYVVKGVSHDFNSNTTTLECIRFYSENCYAYQPALETPIINSASVNLLNVTIIVNAVNFANGYDLYANGKKVCSSTSTTISYTFQDNQTGTYNFTVVATANGYQNSVASVSVELTISNNILVTNIRDKIITNNGNYISYNINDESGG